MKKLYLIGGTMGVGKSTVGGALKKKLHRAVYLDGDWCWDADPFTITDETKQMVMDNICHILNNFLHCSEYKNIVFCWVMHEQSIIDEILSRLDISQCNVKTISLIADEETVRTRLSADIERGARTDDVIARSMERLGHYKYLNTIKIDTTGKTVMQIAEEIEKL